MVSPIGLVRLMIIMVTTTCICTTNIRMRVLALPTLQSIKSMIGVNANTTFSSEEYCCFSDDWVSCDAGFNCCGNGDCHVDNYQCCRFGCSSSCYNPIATDTANVAIIVGVIVAVVVSLLIILAIVWIITENRRRRRQWNELREMNELKIGRGDGLPGCPPHDMQLVGECTARDILCCFCCPWNLCCCAPGTTKRTCTKCNGNGETLWSGVPPTRSAATPSAGAPPFGPFQFQKPPADMPVNYPQQQQQQQQQQQATAEGMSGMMPMSLQMGAGPFSHLPPGYEYTQQPVAAVRSSNNEMASPIWASPLPPPPPYAQQGSGQQVRFTAEQVEYLLRLQSAAAPANASNIDSTHAAGAAATHTPGDPVPTPAPTSAPTTSPMTVPIKELRV